MANLLGLFGFNPSNGSDALIGVHGNDIVDVTNNTGYGQFLSSSNKAEFEAFLDKAWFVNGANANRYFDGSNWFNTGNAVKFPVAKYIKRFKTRLYVADIVIRGTDYPSRVWYSNLPSNNTITWDYETQTNLQQSVGSNIIVSPGAQFESVGIKVGDPITITTGPNASEYKISSVISETQLALTKSLSASDPADTYWVGGNWFDVSTDDNDVITWLGENSDRLLIFKRDSLHRYDGTSLRQIKGVPGTTSGRSVVNIRDWTFYFHRTGIYRLDGVTAQLISRPVQHYLDGMSSANFDDVVAWKVGEDIYRCFIGNISNSDEDITINNCFLDYDTATQTWTPGAYPDQSVVVATSYIESQVKNIYFGTTGSKAYQDNTGNNDGTSTTPIELAAETIWHFPFGVGTEGEHTRLQIYARNGRGVNVKYKLYGIPTNIDKDWRSLGDIQDYVTEFKFKRNDRNSSMGIKFLFSESSVNKPPVIERIIHYGKPKTRRLIE